MSDDLHADFVKCTPEQRWKGRLDALFMQLHTEAWSSRTSVEAVNAGKGWYWRILPHGAAVSMRRRPDIGPSAGGRLELRIARSGELKGEVESRWGSEVSTFLKHFNIRAVDGTEPATMPGGMWLRMPPTPEEQGRPVARFLALMPGEIKPGKARCHDCWQLDPPVLTEVEWFSSFGTTGQACHQHALERGRAERLARGGQTQMTI